VKTEIAANYRLGVRYTSTSQFSHLELTKIYGTIFRAGSTSSPPNGGERLRDRIRRHGQWRACDLPSRQPDIFLSLAQYNSVRSALARCLAPDLIGMGESGRNPRGSYRLADNASYLDRWFEQLELGDQITLVMQDWGTVLGFDWARRHPERVKCMVHMESIIRPMRWEEWPERTREFVARLKSPEGEKLVLEENAIVEGFLPLGTARKLSDAEMTRYRQPYLVPGESRRPTLDLAREIPLAGEPAPACAMVQASADWLVRCEIPKLLISARPGLNLVGPMLDFCRSWPNQREVAVDGIHFLQEDSPDQIGSAIADFLRETNRTG
jgi:haloalkane dehalogenase